MLSHRIIQCRCNSEGVPIVLVLSPLDIAVELWKGRGATLWHIPRVWMKLPALGAFIRHETVSLAHGYVEERDSVLREARVLSNRISGCRHIGGGVAVILVFFGT